MGDRTKLYKDLYIEIYNDLVEQGLSLNKAQGTAYNIVEHAKEIIEDTLDELQDDYWYCNLRRIIPTKHIDGWWTKSNEEKSCILYSLGIDSKNMPWREKCGTHVGIDNKPTEGFFVEGSERIDKEWVKSGCASWECELQYQEKIHGKHHREDLESKMKNRRLL